ncbi:hypothetical protein NZD88_19835 [Chryseobacterium antibioticum]|uniref:DUF4760 domain-containing protein n=1 Tax=Chryseobacterium pyrolae TaxID=2987481 RepID=A0ABT2IMB1_9FLAO|nr:hypothetical protein [Chryseobacterium pyrolae]MCT2409810.1 hypothetical protein [Chryseobacterium pyrolae]
MENYFNPVFITAITSLVISLIALYQFFKSQVFQQKQLEKNLNRNLGIKLYELRLEDYPKAFEITDRIFKTKGGNYDVVEIKHVLNDLIEWKKGRISLILSNEGLQAYYSFRDALMKNPANVMQYSNEQVEKITNLNNNFRKQLRRDLGFLFNEERERRKKSEFQKQ